MSGRENSTGVKNGTVWFIFPGILGKERVQGVADEAGQGLKCL